MPCDHASDKLKFDPTAGGVRCECGEFFWGEQSLNRENCQLVNALVRSVGRRRGGIKGWQEYEKISDKRQDGNFMTG